MVGGSGMYMDALIYGLDSFPEIIPEIRAEISSQYKDLWIKYLQNKLKNLDPEYFLKVDIHNHRR